MTIPLPWASPGVGHLVVGSRSSRLVTGEATPLARPPMPESPEPPEVGRQMGGMVAVSSPYTGGVRGPGVGNAFLDCRGSYTFSKPNS